jgi:hypothetical protein
VLCGENDQLVANVHDTNKLRALERLYVLFRSNTTVTLDSRMFAKRKHGHEYY